MELNKSASSTRPNGPELLFSAGCSSDAPSSESSGYTSKSATPPSFQYTFMTESDGSMSSLGATTSPPNSCTPPPLAGPPPSQEYIGSYTTFTGSAFGELVLDSSSSFQSSQPAYSPGSWPSFPLEPPSGLYNHHPHNSCLTPFSGIGGLPISNASTIGLSSDTNAPSSLSVPYYATPPEPHYLNPWSPTLAGSNNASAMNFFMDENEEHAGAWVLVDPYNLEVAEDKSDSSRHGGGPRSPAGESNPVEKSTSTTLKNIDELPMHMMDPEEEGLTEQQRKKILKAVYSYNYRLAQNNKFNTLKAEKRAIEQKLLDRRNENKVLMMSIRKKLALIEALKANVID